MGTKEVIKKSVLEGFSPTNISPVTAAVVLGIAGLMGLYIYLIYRVSTRRGFYNRNFNKSLAIMPAITAGIMLAMQSNLIISLGMVGALSIVRFRNAVKDSMDLTFMFWSIGTGIIVGTHLFELALVLCLGLTILIFILDIIPSFKSPYMLVLSCRDGADDEIITKTVKKYCAGAKVRSRNVTQRGSEWIFELRIKDGGELLKEISALEGVSSANLLSHDGDARF